MKQHRPVVNHAFVGQRFEDHGVDVDALPDLLAYKALLVETAKELWRRHNPERQRLPKNFEDSLVLKFYEVTTGSAVIPLVREIDVQVGKEFPPPWERDELDDAVELIADVVDAAGQDRALPDAFPAKLLGLFESYGKSLRPDEYFEQHVAKRHAPARYTPAIRERLAGWRSADYEDTVDLLGTVAMARVLKAPRMAIRLDDDREVEAVFKPEHEEAITTALKEHATARVRVEGRGLYAASGQLQRIVEVERVVLLPSGEIPFDVSAQPLWEAFNEIMKSAPQEELQRLPTDGATEHDHYIYGKPKRKL